MLSKYILLCAALALLSAPALGRGGGGRGGGGRGGGSRGGGGHSWGGGHSYSHGSSSHTYPSSHGLSGTGSSHSYPSSHGLSGYGRISKPPSYGGGSHPSQAIHSGGYLYRAPPRYTPTYYNSPQHVYVTQYRTSGSSYGDLLTGLTLYNLGRAHSYNHYYYHDHYSRSRYSDSYSNPTNTEDEATCSLRIEEPGKVSNLQVPCEIVSTFAPKDKTASHSYNETVVTANCTTLYGVRVNGTVVNATTDGVGTMDGSVGNIVKGTMKEGKTEDGTTVEDTEVKCFSLNMTVPLVNPTDVKGPRLEVTGDMKCAVEVRTRLVFTSKEVDCGELIRYSKMPEPEHEKPLVPSRDSYRSWVQNPPWWLSIFFVV